ncbi:MAG TPA: hypothetical protein VE251_08510, partial [Xanthobacteraceae bacterium]|nr:hypothetical protein [Xanthobacteraceae bacterium]
MARSNAAVKRPPAPNPSWPASPAPAGGFGRRPGPDAARAAAVDLGTPTDANVAVEGARRR